MSIKNSYENPISFKAISISFILLNALLCIALGLYFFCIQKSLCKHNDHVKFLYSKQANNNITYTDSSYIYKFCDRTQTIDKKSKWILLPNNKTLSNKTDLYEQERMALNSITTLQLESHSNFIKLGLVMMGVNVIFFFLIYSQIGFQKYLIEQEYSAELKVEIAKISDDVKKHKKAISDFSKTDSEFYKRKLYSEIISEINSTKDKNLND